MAKTEKKMFKSLKKPEFREAFVQMLIHQQGDLGKYSYWGAACRKKCE